MIRRLRLEGFKGVVSGEIELDQLTVLVGPNNSGKTTILEALFLAPNPFRLVPYIPLKPIELLATYHRALNEKGPTMFFNKYAADKAIIAADDVEFTLVRHPNNLIVYANQQPSGYSLSKHRIDDRWLYHVGGFDGKSVNYKVPLYLRFTSNTLLLSTKLVGFAHEYLRMVWPEIVNKGVAAKVARDASRYTSEDYINITIEPFTGGELSLFVMLADGTRVRLTDLGAGIHLYLVNRLLYEHYQPDVILWDDVETHLNPRLLSHVAAWFADLVEEGKQVIVSTHSLEAVRTITTLVEDATVLLTSLKDGKLEARKIKVEELNALDKLGIDPRLAESFLL